ncbi:lipoprotein releasing system, transmembrane protein, LolC/E family [secondary endosymbiont of Heteropsylla cubana]|uniref:Lipoprotein releasing system, transmembrane protein, LolC/E family n=1 Tax=secondary endosymbiont of Heteropsylla cubana TaxID=134287 RepID=J3TZ90_9ENTR|nr:lipoprotein-releasing ABC transporter permease subunit LolC [secondary endosymbiont of Heteropsylla cubana]AFP85815.1 lipoprotein releasing system, transmembrane protein, LolC/E family [secondary endosymbiont of Heteropsylla cubana]
MYQPVVLYIGMRYVLGRGADRFFRVISWFSTIAITFGVMAIITVLSVMNGFEHELESKILDFIPHALLTTSYGHIDSHYIPDVIKDTFLGITPITVGDIVIQSTRGLSIGVMLGVNPKDPEPLASYVVEGCLNNLIPGQYRVILGNELAAILGVKCCDKVRLIFPGANQFTAIGRIPNQRLFTVIGIFSAKSEVDCYQLLVNQSDASRLMGYPSGYISGWRLWLEKPLSVDKINTQLLPGGLVWKDWRERKGALFQAMRLEKNIMSLLLSLIVGVAAFNILTSVGLFVIEKKSEIAILQTQGLTRRQVMLIFIIQGSITGIIGAFLGTTIGILVATHINRLILIFEVLIDGRALPVVIEPLQVITIMLSAMLLAIIATIYPSWYAATIYPAEALRYV